MSSLLTHFDRMRFALIGEFAGLDYCIPVSSLSVWYCLYLKVKEIRIDDFRLQTEAAAKEVAPDHLASSTKTFLAVSIYTGISLSIAIFLLGLSLQRALIEGIHTL